MSNIFNPYGTVMTIREAENFIGREDALDYLFAEIAAQRCVSIVGTRRIGKSSLLQCMCLAEIQRRFKQHYKHLQRCILVFIDLGEFSTRSSEDFFKTVCQQLINQGKSRLVLEMPDEESYADRFWQMLEQVQMQGYHTVLLLDAFHRVTSNTEFGPSFFSFMRAQANHGRVSYVTASIQTLDLCCHPYIEGSPFFNIFNVYHLGPFTQTEIRQLIEEPARAVQRPFNEQEILAIIQLAGRHPFFAQRIAYTLFQEKWSKPQPDESALHRNGSFKRAAYDDLVPHFENIWEKVLTSRQREELRNETLWKDMPERKYPELSGSALFRRFVCDTCHIHPVDLSVEQLDEILSNFNNARFLGECEIAQLYLFAARTQHAISTRHVADKGLVVRTILKEARDRLKPEGEQSDIAPEWLFYNILNYRYFKERMRIEMLAHRLATSKRQLQRDRLRALAALREVLNEMESAARKELGLD